MKTIRPDKSGYLVFLFVGVINIVPGMLAAYKNVKVVWLILVWCFFIVIAWLIIASYEIKIDEEKIEFKYLFFCSRSIFIHEIEKAEFKFFSEASPGPPIRLVVYAKHNLSIKPIIINAKLFNLNDIRYLLNKLNHKD